MSSLQNSSECVQVCVLSLKPEPTVVCCNGVCNARILSIVSVPNLPTGPGAGAGAGRGAGAVPPPQGVAWPQLGPGTPGLTQVGQRFWVWRSR